MLVVCIKFYIYLYKSILNIIFIQFAWHVNLSLISLYMTHFQGSLHELSPYKPEDSVRVTQFWVTLLTSTPNWVRERPVLYLLDRLVQAAYTVPGGFDTLLQYFSKLYKVRMMKRYLGHKDRSYILWANVYKMKIILQRIWKLLMQIAEQSFMTAKTKGVHILKAYNSFNNGC